MTKSELRTLRMKRDERMQTIAESYFQMAHDATSYYNKIAKEQGSIGIVTIKKYVALATHYYDRGYEIKARARDIYFTNPLKAI